MNPKPDRVEALFAAAVARPVEERAAYLDQACGNDAELRRRVEALLQAHDDAGSFLEKPAVAPAVTTDLPVGRWIDRDAAPALAEGPGTRIGPYKLLQQIGEGGMGTVFMAEQEQPVRRRVALKIIKPGMDSAQVIARFEAERQALALMDHPNIAHVFDGGTTASGRPYFVMELVYGVPITKFCDDSQLTPRQRLELFVPICQAIQHAHQKGIIHRDIKPSNVLVTMHDDKPVPKVIDFGVAKAIEQRLTEKSLFTAFGAVVGTLEYMSPEQAEMNAFGVDTRSDVYSLGVLLYELLTGTTPLERKRLREEAYSEVVRLIKEVEPPRPSVRLSSSGDLLKIAAARKTEPARLSRVLRGEIDWIVMRCLEKDRTRRYESASALARDVERYLTDEAVEACPPSVGYRLRKFARKYRVMLSTAAAFAALLLIATGVSIWLALAARRAEAEADDKRKDAEIAQEEAADERDRAQKEWRRAEDATKKAQANAVETGRALDRMSVAKGIELAEEGKVFAALPQFIKPLERGGLSPEEQKMHRTRIAFYLRYSPGRPKLRHILFYNRQSDWDQEMAFSADAKRVLAVDGQVVHVWDLQRGRLLATLQHSGVVRWARFSPDGTRVLTNVLDEATIRKWDAASGRCLDSAFVGLDVTFEDWGGLLQQPMALLPTSPWLMLGSADAEDSFGTNFFPRDVEVNEDASRILLAFPKSLRLLDWESHKLYGQWSKKWDYVSGGDIHKLSPDGRCLLRVRDGVVWVHDTSSGKLPSRTIDHGSPVEFVTFSSDSTRAVTLGKGVAQVWDARTWKPLTRIRVIDAIKRSLINTARFSPDNRLLACWWTLGRNLAWWDVESGQIVGQAPDITDDLLSFDWRPDSQQFVRVSRANSGEVTIWDAASDWQKMLVLPHFGVTKAVYAPDGRTLATVGKDGVICIWDFCDRHDAFEWEVPAKNGFGPDILLRHHISRVGQSGLMWWQDQVPELNVKTPAGPKTIISPDLWRFLPPGVSWYSAALSPDRRRVITWSSSGVNLWDANTKQAVGKPPKSVATDSCVVFSPNSQMFATASDQGLAQLHNARTGELVGKPLKHDTPVYFIAFSPNGELLVTCSADSTARLWRTKTGEPTGEIFRHGDYVTRAAFTPNGKIVATASLDGTVRLWEVGRGISAGVLELKNSVPFDLAFHPNGSLLMVSLWDQKQNEGKSGADKIRIFDVASLQEISPSVNGLENRYDRLQFRLRKDGRFAFGLFDQRSWDLTPDNRSVGDLTKLGQLYSGQRLNERGDTSPLNKQELEVLWRELSAKYPEEFEIRPKAAVDWRIGQLQSASNMKRPDLVVFHRRWLSAELTEAGWQAEERGNEDMELGNYLQRLFALAVHGKHTEAVAAADALAVRWAKDQDTLYNCACVHALAAGAVKGDAALADRYAARAVVLLRQAAAAGYADGQHIFKDPDLDALRRRKDFRNFLWDLAESP